MLYNAVVITMNFCCHTQKMFHQEINFEANTLCWRCYLYVLRREKYIFTKLFEEHWKLTGEWISPLSSKSSPPLESLNPLQANYHGLPFLSTPTSGWCPHIFSSKLPSPNSWLYSNLSPLQLGKQTSGLHLSLSSCKTNPHVLSQAL